MWVNTLQVKQRLGQGILVHQKLVFLTAEVPKTKPRQEGKEQGQGQCGHQGGTGGLGAGSVWAPGWGRRVRSRVSVGKEDSLSEFKGRGLAPSVKFFTDEVQENFP